jgi:hypothetical protein
VKVKKSPRLGTARAGGGYRPLRGENLPRTRSGEAPGPLAVKVDRVSGAKRRMERPMVELERP